MRWPENPFFRLELKDKKLSAYLHHLDLLRTRLTSLQPHVSIHLTFYINMLYELYLNRVDHGDASKRVMIGFIPESPKNQPIGTFQGNEILRPYMIYKNCLSMYLTLFFLNLNMISSIYIGGNFDPSDNF
ncbi:hypothetical protein Hdeb2414_s1237g00994801 [Helianthus debilis subsp. tardiflorus]